MGLTIEHIQHYLTYGLRVQLIEDKGTEYNKKEYVLTEINVDTDLCKIKSNGYVFAESIHSIKPLLLPLSALYEEIDGEIGIVELAKIESGLSDLGKHRIAKQDNSGGIKYDEYDDEDYSHPVIFSFSLEHGFAIQTMFPEKNTTVGASGTLVRNQLQLWNYLFSHHYDVFDLCSKGLAIDKRSVK